MIELGLAGYRRSAPQPEDRPLEEGEKNEEDDVDADWGRNGTEGVRGA